MRIGIVGVSGYGGSELLRLCVEHPSFELVYVGADSSAGQALSQRFAALGGRREGALVIQRFVPEEVGELDLLFASLPTGISRDLLARLPLSMKIVDVGGERQ